MMQEVPAPAAGSAATGVEGANAALNALVDRWLEYGLLLLAVGTAAMAAVELIKAVSRLRLVYHRRRVREWCENSAAAGSPEAYSQLLMLAASDPRYARAVFDQPAEKMMAQIQAAAGVAMDFPERYTALYRFVTQSKAEAEGMKAQAATFASGESPQVNDSDLWLKFAMKHRESDEAVQMMIDGKGGATPDSVKANEARSRLDLFVARKLDSFQSSLEYAWARINQGLAGVGSTGVLLYILWGVESSTLAWASWSVLGGFVSPFAKDFVSALQRLRG